MRILYTGAFRFPDGDAAASRVLSIAKILKYNGVTVVFAGWEAPDDPNSPDNCRLFNGFDSYSMNEFRTETKGAVARIFGFLFQGRKTLAWIKMAENFDLIIAYNPPAIFAARLRVFGLLTGIKTALDSTEWYQSSHLPGGRFGPVAIENFVRMRLVYPRFDNIICISNFLERYFSGRNLAKIPPLSKPRPRSVRPDISASAINLIYAGNPGQKDDLLPVIRALPTLYRNSGIRAHLTVAGVDWPTLSNHLAENRLAADTHQEFITCLGRIPKKDVLALYAKSHFSILFRQSERYALAGFPTKAVESWAAGCPIICNPVGDISEIGRDNHEVLFITADAKTGEATDMLADKLGAVLAENRYQEMSASCRELATLKFSAGAFQQKLQGFVEKTGATGAKT